MRHRRAWFPANQDRYAVTGTENQNVGLFALEGRTLWPRSRLRFPRRNWREPIGWAAIEQRAHGCGVRRYHGSRFRPIDQRSRIVRREVLRQCVLNRGRICRHEAVEILVAETPVSERLPFREVIGSTLRRLQAPHPARLENPPDSLELVWRGGLLAKDTELVPHRARGAHRLVRLRLAEIGRAHV